MNLIRALHARRLTQCLSDQQTFYNRAWTPAEISRWQLAKLNAQWPAICRHVAYFRQLHQARQVPDSFDHWQTFQETVPILDRATIQDHGPLLMSQARSVHQWRTTGGSTAQPLRISVSKSEVAIARRDLWYGRTQLGIIPSDRMFLLWGHSHALGHGWKGSYHRYKRHLLDRLLGYDRWPAYEVSPPHLRRAAEALLRHRPSYLVGYATSLTHLAQVNRDRRPDFHRLGLKCAIATAESFPRPESQQEVADILGCPVIMEYGAVETGPIAQQQPDGHYTVFWRHYMIEAHPSPHCPGAYDILLTSLFPRCLPLIRYKVGDLIRMPLDAGPEQAIHTFATILGRSHDVVTLPSGARIHAEAFSHAVKNTHAIHAYQVVQSAPDEVVLCYTAAQPLSAADLAAIRQRLQRIHAELGHIHIRHVGQLAQTMAGKTQRLVRQAA
ncbi:MAG: hypothetical protein ETSY2_22915 [Candidatus Entotheonella gemina]|uniref:AMP-dependent synthetase/ligase domain-containing protein n=1 Tax=Candidatus Entotheonella gemina TaxID=1429439 RepID=W4M5G2_9BACT|nr:MAG: hypothetical protein ETSY2_22915 [Candidatus Entotheonella gemina]